MKRRVVVCGAAGFIGRNIAESLAAEPEQFDVVGIHHRRPPFGQRGITWRRADLTDRAQAEQAISGADIVIQAAAVTSGAKDIVQRPHIHVADNAVMNSHLLRAAFEQKVGHFVFFSCSIMYPAAERPQKEEDFTGADAIDPKYFGAAWTKLYVERMCEFYARTGETRFTVVRHSNIYGPHDKFDLDRSHVFGATVTKVMTAGDGRIAVWGSGKECRDLLYVSDLVDFVRLALDRQADRYGLYNVGTGVAHLRCEPWSRPSFLRRARTFASSTTSAGRRSPPPSHSTARARETSWAGSRPYLCRQESAARWIGIVPLMTSPTFEPRPRYRNSRYGRAAHRRTCRSGCWRPRDVPRPR